MSTLTPPLMELIDVARRFASADGSASPVQVLRDVCLSVEQGQTVAIVGPSGSGKSTLLNIMATLDRPTTGRVLIDGKDVQSLPDSELTATRRNRIGLVFQSHHLLPQCTALENVLVPTLAGSARESRHETAARARQLLERVGLGTRLSHRPGQLSGGQRQRVALVRALINEPSLLLADEPTGSLDRQSAAELADLLMEINAERRVAIVLATHSAELARRMARVFEVRDGRLVPAGGDG